MQPGASNIRLARTSRTKKRTRPKFDYCLSIYMAKFPRSLKPCTDGHVFRVGFFPSRKTFPCQNSTSFTRQVLPVQKLTCQLLNDSNERTQDPVYAPPAETWWLVHAAKFGQQARQGKPDVENVTVLNLHKTVTLLIHLIQSSTISVVIQEFKAQLKQSNS